MVFGNVNGFKFVSRWYIPLSFSMIFYRFMVLLRWVLEGVRKEGFLGNFTWIKHELCGDWWSRFLPCFGVDVFVRGESWFSMNEC